jgi:hypothetical protein
MGAVAGQTGCFLQRLVNRFLLKLFRFVTLETEVTKRCLQKALLWGSMWIVAANTLIFLERRVQHRFVHPDFVPGMTAVAALVAGNLQQQLGNHSVAQMALLAL